MSNRKKGEIGFMTYSRANVIKCVSLAFVANTFFFPNSKLRSISTQLKIYNVREVIAKVFTALHLLFLPYMANLI